MGGIYVGVEFFFEFVQLVFLYVYAYREMDIYIYIQESKGVIRQAKFTAGRGELHQV